MNQWEKDFRERVGKHCAKMNILLASVDEGPLDPDEMVERLKERMAEGEWERLTHEE